MKVTIEILDDINIIFSGTVEQNVIKERFAKLKEQSDEKTDEKIQEEVESQVLQEFIDAGLKLAGIDVANVLGQPGFRKYEKQEENIYYEIQISTNPTIDANIDYKDIVPSFTKPEIDPKDIDAQVAQLATQQTPFTKIEQERALRNRDLAVIDFEGFIDNEPFEGGKSENFKLRIGSDIFIPGFEEQIVGMNTGEEKTITIHFPQDYVSQDLAGKETQFKVKLHEIQEQKALPIDDYLAQKIFNDEAVTLDTLKDKVRAQLVSQALSDVYRNELKPQLILGLLTKFDFTLPNNIVEQEIDAKVREILQKMSKEELELQKNDKEKFHQLRNSVREEAEGSIKIALIVEALAAKEGIIVEDQEVSAALHYQANMTGQNPHELLKYYQDNNLITSVKVRLMEDKLFGEILGLYK